MIDPTLSFSEYLGSPAFGSSDLRAFRKGPPALVQWSRAMKDEQTDATVLGSACHSKILTPALFDQAYRCKPDGMSFATKEGKAWKADPDQAGKIILSFAQGKAVDAVAEAFQAKR